MAEGGYPAPKEEDVDYPKWNWDRGSLEYVFASDFIHFVIEREDKGWRSHGLITHRSPVTPFNTAIQNAVEGVLKQDSTCLNIVFRQITKHYDKLNQARFNTCAVFLKLSYFGRFDRFGTLLKYFCIIGQFSVWALGQGLHTAPFFCVDIIMGYMREFLVEHNFTSMDDFWYFFEREAGDALRLPNILTLKEEDLRCLLDMQKLTEVPSEEMSSGMEKSSEKLQVEEPEIEVAPKNAETEASGQKVLPEKEVSKVDSPAKEVASKVDSPAKEVASKVDSPAKEVASKVDSPAKEDEGLKKIANIKQVETGASSKGSTVLKESHRASGPSNIKKDPTKMGPGSKNVPPKETQKKKSWKN